MKIIAKEITNDYDAIEIIPLGDLHLGDVNCNMAKIEEKIDYIKSRIGCYCILNGDLANNTIKASVGNVYDEEYNPMEQIAKIVELFKPIRDKILLITCGNHERRTYKETGIDIMYMVAMQLGILDKYTSETAVLFVSFGHYKNCYSIYVSHGAGGGTKAGSKINKLAEMSRVVDADIYVHSHTHLPAVFRESYYRLNTQAKTAVLVDRVFVNTASMLNYGGYGEINGLTPASNETPSIVLVAGKNKKIMTKM